MELILGFIYKGSNYYIVEDGNKIYLGKYVDNLFITIPDAEKVELRNLIKILLGDKIDTNSLEQYNLSIIEEDSFSLAGGLSSAIILELPDRLRKNLNKNCKKISKNSKNSGKKTNGLVKLILALLAVLLIGGVVIYFINFKPDKPPVDETSNNKLLEKYTYVVDSTNELYSMNIEFVEIKNNIVSLSFEDSFLSFLNPYDNSLNSIHYDEVSQINRYSGQPELDIVYFTNNTLNGYNFSDLNNKYSISVENVLSKNNIKTKTDLISSIVNNDSKVITNKSSEVEMIEHYVFDILKPVVIPFDNDSIHNELFVLKGDKKGYVHITDNRIIITLENFDKEYQMVYNYTDESVQKLTKDQIVNLVSTVVFNQ